MKVVLQDLTKIFPARKKGGTDTVAVDHFTYEIPDGKLIGLLGPSGCGKSTTLYMISGLQTPTEGKIFFGDQDVTALPAEQRGVGLVFQNYALYPHLTVLQNIRFPLENLKGKDKLSKAEMHRRAQEAAALVQIEGLLDRKPSELSGGQQQRVAIARALVKMPKVLLLDEPLSNLDARLRLEMREEIRRIQIETGVTTVFVTHDQEEAMSITDEIVLMKKGIVQQQCAPQEMYLNPGNQFVASFLGNPPISYFRFPMQDGCLQISDSCRLPLSLRHDGAVVTGIRPEAWRKGDGLAVQVQAVEQHGKDNQITFQLAGTKARALLDVTEPVRVGDTVSLTLDPRFVYFFDEATGTRLYGEAGQ